MSERRGRVGRAAALHVADPSLYLAGAVSKSYTLVHTISIIILYNMYNVDNVMSERDGCTASRPFGKSY